MRHRSVRSHLLTGSEVPAAPPPPPRVWASLAPPFAAHERTHGHPEGRTRVPGRAVARRSFGTGMREARIIFFPRPRSGLIDGLDYWKQRFFASL